MCFDPASMAIISAGTALLGGAVSAAGAEENASVQAQIARNNAQTAMWNANVTAEAGDARAANQGLKTAQTVGKMRAAFGAAGIDPNQGSAADVQAAADSAGLTDAETIRSDAARQAWGYEVQSSNFSNQASADEAAGNWGALSSFLGGATSAAGSASMFGAFGGGSSFGSMPNTFSTFPKNFSSWQ
jgi:hypothetical protein